MGKVDAHAVRDNANANRPVDTNDHDNQVVGTQNSNQGKPRAAERADRVVIERSKGVNDNLDWGWVCNGADQNTQNDFNAND